MEAVEDDCMVYVCVHAGETMIKKTWQSVAVFAAAALQVTILDHLIHSQNMQCHRGLNT